LALHCDRNWQAWPSIPTIAEIAGVHPRSAQKAINRFVEVGLLTKECGIGRSNTNVYTLHQKVASCPPLFTDTKGGDMDATLSGEKRRRSDPEKVALEGAKGGDLDATRSDEHLNTHTVSAADPSGVKKCTGRKRDPIWDAVMEATKFVPKGSGQSRAAKAVKDLKDRDATVAQIHCHADVYRSQAWRDAVLTPWTLERAWDELSSAAAKQGDSGLIDEHIEPTDTEIAEVMNE